ncbi:MAG: GHKL domain-containing protein [Clostridiales bacterium]|nr:GHKL domain-containing protein [Clostridiales bacterium]
MTAQDVFEELRFVWELMSADVLFLLPFAQRKGSWRREILGLLLFSVLSLFFLPVRRWMIYHEEFSSIIIGCWFILLTLLIMLYSCFCFQLTTCDALYMCIAGYAAQHIVYVLVHEVAALRLWPGLPEVLWLYVLLSALACTALYSVLHRLFARKLSRCRGQLIEDTPGHVIFYVACLAALMFCTYGYQHLFLFNREIEVLSALLDILTCVMILGIQYSSVQMILYGREQAEIQQMLHDGERNYALSKELVEVVNRSAHDLKYTLNALKMEEGAERQRLIHETEQNIHQYQQLVHTDNEALNTILSEKSLLCDKREISFTCSLDDVNLDFLSLPDLYTLLGNAIDNAIEGVSQIPDPKKRVISLTIQRHHGIISIQTNNFYQGELQFQSGLPCTTKEDPTHHGYGLKSIRYLAEKYGGSMCVSTENHVFILQIMLPVQNEVSPG